MNWNIWYYVAEYPLETILLVIICIVVYFVYVELSKFWHKPLYIFGDGWRIKRYVGRIIMIKDGKKFYAKTSKIEDFTGIIKMAGQPRRKIILQRDALHSFKPNKVIMKKKYVVWSKKDNAYILTNIKIESYLLDLENVQRYDFNMIDLIDHKATRSARASPKLIHSVFSMHNIPLDDYEEEGELVIKTGKDVYDIESAGSYGVYLDLEDKYRKEQEKDEAEHRTKLGLDDKKEAEYDYDAELGDD